MTKNANIGQAFPLESLGSDIVRNEYNYQSILNGLVEWNHTESDEVIIRLTKDTDPFFQDYIIPSKKSASDSCISENIVTGLVAAGEVSLDSAFNKSVYGGSMIFDNINWKIDDSDVGDMVTIRVNVHNKGYVNEWQVNYLPLVHIWDLDSRFRYNNYVTYDNKYYKALTNVDASKRLVSYSIEEINATDSRVTYPSHGLSTGSVFTITGSDHYDGTHTITTITLDTFTFVYNPVTILVLPSITDLFEVDHIATATTSGVLTDLNVNDFVKVTGTTSYDGIYEVLSKPTTTSFTYNIGKNALTETGLSGVVTINDVRGEIYSANKTPDLDTNNYVEITSDDVSYQPIPNMANFSNNVVFRWQPNVDIAGFIIKNASSSDSDNVTSLELDITTKQKQFDSIYQRSVGTFADVNYTMYPYNTSNAWSEGESYSTNDTIDLLKRQDYTASMVFIHTDQKSSNTINYINYEGPDLENGLSIYLPTEIDLGNGGYSLPEDGFTYEFYFRIWANTKYTDARTRDHIINKSHIHVHSCTTLNDALTDDCNNLIAKFSMARMTNMHIYGENISIPDKPVIYRATFVYSSAERSWITLDYYQLPDHIFMGPVGFVDPTNPSNTDINGTGSGINPNAKFIGYETGALPMFTDMFSKPDLSPIRLSDVNLDKFKNRLS